MINLHVFNTTEGSCCQALKFSSAYFLVIPETCLLMSHCLFLRIIPFSGYTVRGLISAKHRFLCPAVISAITISVKQSYTKSRDRVKIATCDDVCSMTDYYAYT